MYLSSSPLPPSALPWQSGDAQPWITASAAWQRNAALSDTFLNVLMDGPSKADAWRALKAGQMPRAVLERWIHGYSTERLAARDHGAFAAADDNGVGWDMPACSHYTGAALVLPEQVGGDFDAQVQFMCSHFSAGVALELAAIAVGPQSVMGHKDSIKGAGPKSGHGLVFDVHGTPPYASAECDEVDGFRMSWNTSFSVTEFVPSAASSDSSGQVAMGSRPQSSNLYNAYGKDFAPAHWPQPHQWHGLRLVRRGHRFACLYRAMNTGPWLCAGEVTHSAMPGAVHLRLAAKHWPKSGNYAVGTRIRFRHFELYQPDGSAIAQATPHVLPTQSGK